MSNALDILKLGLVGVLLIIALINVVRRPDAVVAEFKAVGTFVTDESKVLTPSN